MAETKAQMLASLILETARAPTYNALEVGFRHSALTQREEHERMRRSFQDIEAHAAELLALLSPSPSR